MIKKAWIILWTTGIILASCVSSFAKEAQNVKQNSIIHAKVGKDLVITLESNRTTGYSWQLASSIDRDFLVVVGLRYIVPNTKAVGVGGKEEWTLRALKPGKTVVVFKYVRPWEKNKAPAKTKTFSVVIK